MHRRRATPSPSPWVASKRSAIVCFIAAMTAVAVATGCRPAAFTQYLDARRIAADMHVQFTKAAEAANRAVMAETDEASARAAREARDAAQLVERDRKELQPILASLGYADELRYLGAFTERFSEYRTLDDEILPLAVENSNLKAQRLSFGPARDASDEFRRSLETAARSDAAEGTCCADALVAKAGAALLETQVLHAPHIAEADDAAMARMEEQMAAAEAVAQKALIDLRRLLRTKAGAQMAAAAAALERFKDINRQIITLSRRNSDVRSLALSLGRKRMVTATAEDQLRALEEALAKHQFRGIR